MTRGENLIKSELLQVVLEHCFAIKEDEDAKDFASSLYEIAGKADSGELEALLVPQILKVPKLQSAQHVQLLLNLLRSIKDEAKLKEIMDSLSEHVMGSLTA